MVRGVVLLAATVANISRLVTWPSSWMERNLSVRRFVIGKGAVLPLRPIGRIVG